MNENHDSFNKLNSFKKYLSNPITAKKIIHPKKLERNPAETKHQLKKRTEMTVKSAKRFWFSPRIKGRPSKLIAEKLKTAKGILTNAGVPLKRALKRSDGKRGRPSKPKEITLKRPKGRPRKHPIADPSKPKQLRGRPRKHPKADPSKPKLPRGRPRTSAKLDKPKLPRGRPRTKPKENNITKRSRGRPRKNLETSQEED